MRILTDRKEIAKAMNFGNYPVLTLDMTNHRGFDVNEPFEYSVGCDVRVEYNSKYGTMYTKGHLYVEDNKFHISNNATCLSSSFGYSDVMEMSHWANTPMVKAGQDVVVILDFKNKNSCVVTIMSVEDRIDPHCSTVATLK